MYHHVQQSEHYILPTQCICVFCTNLRTHNIYFPVQTIDEKVWFMKCLIHVSLYKGSKGYKIFHKILHTVQ